MAESPTGILPDFFLTLEPQGFVDFSTEVLVNRDGTEQRRSVFRTGGYRRFVVVSAPLTLAERFALRTFLKSKDGRRGAFYAWTPALQVSEGDIALGSVASASRIVVPIRITGPHGGGSPLAGVIGSINDVRVAGLTKAFSRLALTPRPTTYVGLSVDGSAAVQGLACGTNASLRPAGAFSVGGWVFREDATTSGQIATNEITNASGFSLFVSGSNLTLRTSQASANTSVTASSTALGVSASWAHVMAVFNGTTGTLYVNGAQVGSPGALTAPVTATAAFTIYYNNSAGGVLVGMLQSVRFYNAALSAGEVLNIYSGNATPSANLVGWWRMMEGSGTTVADSSGNGNTGTVTVSAQWVAGEEVIKFTGGAQTGAVTAWGTVRERLTVRLDSDSVEEAFWRESGAPLAVIRLPLKEVA